MTDRFTDNINGLDANNGTTALTPKQNLHAHTLVDGDVLYVKGTGTAYNRAGSTYTLDATARAGITIQRWPGFPKPTITHTGGGGFGRALGVGAGGSNPVLVSGLIFDTTDEGGLGSAGTSTANVVVEDCEFYNCGLANDSLVIGSSIVIGTGTSIASLRVLNCNIINSGRANIFANVTGTYEVANSTVCNPGIANPAGNTGDCIESGVSPSAYWVHHNALIHPKNSKQCVQQSGGTTGLATIEFNDMTGPIGIGDSHKSVYLEMPAIVRGNKIITGGFGINLKAGGVINSNCILVMGPGWGSNQGAILAENDLNTTCDIDHNTITLVSDGTAFYSAISAYFDATKGTGRIRNNVITGPWAVGIRRHSTAWTDTNNCIHGQRTFAVADENLSQRVPGAGTITANPLLRNHILPDLASPIIGAGTPISGYVDILGGAYLPRPSMGCVERFRSTVKSERGYRA